MSAQHARLGRLEELARELGHPFDVQPGDGRSPQIVFGCGCSLEHEGPGTLKAVTCRERSCAVAQGLWRLARRYHGARSYQERTAAGERLERFRVRTELAHDDRGWWVEVLWWWNDRAAGTGEPVRPEDDCFRVGPWPSRQVARREMRGGVRRGVVDTVQRFARQQRGTIERFDVGDDEELRAQVEQALVGRPS